MILIIVLIVKEFKEVFLFCLLLSVDIVGKVLQKDIQVDLFSLFWDQFLLLLVCMSTLR